MKESWGQNLDLFMSLGLQSGPWLGLGYSEAAPLSQALILGLQTCHPKCTSGKLEDRSGGSPPAGAGSRGAGAGLAAGRAAPSSEGGLSWPLRAC